MVGTRRKSKAAAVAAAAAEEHDGASTSHTDESHHAFNVPIPIDVDIDALSNIIPDVSFSSPTPETIVSVYRILLGQFADADITRRELEESRAEVERKDVELDQAIQDRESQTKDLESSLEEAHGQLEQVKKERDQLATSKNELQTQLSMLTNSQSSSSVELDQYRHRVEDAEREKRDMIGVVSRLKEDASQRDEEIQSLRSNLKQARQEYQALETQVRELRSTETSNKFKRDTLTQQLELAQKEAERASQELTAKTEDYAQYRRTKHSEFAQLQASMDALTQTHASLESSFKALQSSHSGQSHQLSQALATVQDLKGQIAEQEAAFASEVSGLRRLVGIMEEREKTAKGIVESIEQEWARVGDRAEKREATLRAETERERKARADAEKRADQLEAVLERINRGDLPVPSANGGAPGTPGTPARNGDPMADGMYGLSPTVAMVSKAQRGGKTFTEVYADYVRLQDEFAKKSAEYDHMDRTLSAVLAQIEERAPILSQQRDEYERLQSEAAQLASQLSSALGERDAHASALTEASQKLKKSTDENKLLTDNLNDLGRQVQMLLKELGRRSDPSIPASDEELEALELPAPSALPENDIDAVITNNLVLFKSIPELQEQNRKLLKVVREMGAKMEAEEKEYRSALEQEQSEAVREAHEAMRELAEQLERQKRSAEVTIQAYMKERDALRSMLAREDRGRGAGTGEGAGSGDVVMGDGNGIGMGGANGSGSALVELEEVQAQFESYKTEMGIDSSRLREELTAAQREVGALNANLAKANAKIEYFSDRQRMSQEQLSLQSRDLDNLQKRNQQLYDQYTRMDVECHRASDELVTANSRVEQLRNENANLRAEKRIWEGVQSRLEEENKSLAVERSRLSDLISNVQKMHNDLERSGENDRRRLEGQVQLLESQAQDLKTQLSQERDTVRHMALQKDVEGKDLQSRLDKTVELLSETRATLAGLESTKNHLQERVDFLTRQLHGNEEKLAVYERRGGSSNGNAPTRSMDEDLPREQQLEQEVAELRSALKVAEVDLASARSHMQQFQEISQANEAALSALNTTHDQYKAETEARLVKNEAEYKTLQEKLREAEEELRRANAKYAELQSKFETERTTWANDKKTLEETIVDISSQEKNSESDRALKENDFRQLEQRAIAAEERYSREVVTHAESIKVIDGLKQQLSAAQTTARDNSLAAANAQAMLESADGSWKQQREALDKEIADLNARCKDLAAQNTLLHQHLESVSSQAARIRQAADTATAEGQSTDEASGDVDTKVSELRSVVGYLRKEKEIVDLQLELSRQENLRLKNQIEHLTQSLSETRTTLGEERQKALEAATSDSQHAELIERINQLNILRESNATLRADCENYAKRSRELDAKVKELSAQLDPVKEEARVAKAELSARAGQISRLEEENKRWQERNQQLLTKYDRIDPADMQSLKDEIQALQAQKAEFDSLTVAKDAQIADLRTKLLASESETNKHLENMKRNTGIYRRRFEGFNADKKQLETTIEELKAQIEMLTTEKSAVSAAENSSVEATNALNQQLEALKQEKQALEKTLAEERERHAAAVQQPPQGSTEQIALIDSLRRERDQLLSEKESWKQGAAPAAEANGTWEKEKDDLVKARDEALAQVKNASEDAQKARDEAKNIRSSNEKFQMRIQDMQKARERAASEQANAVAAAVEKVRNELASSSSAPSDDETTKRHAAELEALRVQLVAQHEEKLKQAVDAAVARAKAEVPPADASSQEAIDAAINARLEEITAKHNEEITAAVERGRMEQAAKSKIKDAQLVRSQTKLKELEAQIAGWRDAGLVPEAPASTTPAAKAGPSGAAAAKPAGTAATTLAAANNGQTVKPAAPIPAKPVAAQGGVTAPTASSAARATGGGVPLGTVGAGRGRGAVRGAIAGRGTAGRGIAIRGAAPGRGGAPAAAAAGATSTAGGAAAAPTEGVSIMGAASKRGREDDNLEDSLAKRLRPAGEGAAAVGGAGVGAGGNKPPVTLRRPPPAS